MKILQVIPFFYPTRIGTGPAYVAYNISKELKKNGHEIFVYTSDSSDKKSKVPFRHNSLNGIKVNYFYTIGKKFAWDNRLFITPGMIVETRKIIKQIDIIHMHDFRTFQNIIIWFYAKIYKVPYIIQAHGTTTTTEKTIIKYIFDIIFGNKLLKDADKLIALSQKEAKLYANMKVPKDKIQIIPNGIDIAIDREMIRGNFKNKYNISKKNKLILFVGRVHKIKGLQLLIPAFSKVLENYPNAKLVIVGPDDCFLSELMKLINEYNLLNHVILTGYLEGINLYDAYIDSDIFVLPSIYDAFPISVLEACSFGLPVIITTENGMAEWIQKYSTGIVVEYNINQFTEALLKLLKDESICSEYSKNGKNLVQKFNWGNIAKSIEFVYNQVEKNRIS